MLLLLVLVVFMETLISLQELKQEGRDQALLSIA
jgi:hypothetical protein